jgi:hypothetical protein
MATTLFEAYYGGTPAWTDISTNRLGFSGSLTSVTTVAALAFQDGTHVVSGTPGSDVCATNHARNVKWLTDTTMSVNGAASETINDTNLADAECTFRVHFNDAAAYALENGRLYTYNNTTTTTEATGIDVAMYVKSNSMSAWFHINDATTTGATGWTTGGIGGDNSGERISLASQAAAADHYYYCGMSVSPETAGGKSAFAIGCYLEYY